MNLAFFVFAFALGGFLISTSGVFLFYKNLKRQYEQILGRWIEEAKGNGFFSDCFNQIGFEEEMSILAEEKLDRLVLNFKERVPMVAVFLNGELEETLKAIAKEELLNLVPNVQAKLISRLEDTNRLDQLINNSISKMSSCNHFSIFLRLQLPSLILGGILGALFGFVLYFYLWP